MEKLLKGASMKKKFKHVVLIIGGYENMESQSTQMNLKFIKNSLK